MIHLSIDRFEGDYAVCENSGGEMSDILICLLPKGIKEGDIVALHDDGHYEFDIAETERRRKEIIDLQNKLFEE
ncbi:DUF3006 family protein [Hydrogenoanaerobacterium saccharovorans]|uniref:DUF3006 domain-containing protein n=1 Tax=Hydrogenoanaerobacterium saccharovorans TaxID=474960 RepID=A0A1H8D123_9FIRM|nr:DUF3006 domain-containing protein [Hydrogenoanaerobacterium saccharovorans]RPF43440.1 DUF3006 family protein [Hydrogenoanaerobacterium saccharovorans]SEN01151.1 Protein of unknown function [Hydrogenoanaerobacterium saccharovorans]